MIRKITGDEYFIRLGNMSAGKKGEYLARVGEWLERQAPLLRLRISDETARFQNVIQSSAMWDDDTCKAWEDGVRLLTALHPSDQTWLPDALYTRSTRRCIAQLEQCLHEAARISGKAKEERQEGTAAATGTVAPGVMPTSVTQSSGGEPCVILPNIAHMDAAGGDGVPVRPRHIDQYVHLLPEKTQKKAAMYGQLMRDLDEAREAMRVVMDDPHASSAVREGWAKKATSIDGKLKAIRMELDREWDKLAASGRVTVDDLGNAHVVECPADAAGEAPKKRGRHPVTEGQKSQKASAKEDKKRQEDQRKASSIRKWLIDRRNAKTDAQKEKWAEKFKEMVSLAGEQAVTDKVYEAAEYYGISLKKIKKTK